MSKQKLASLFSTALILALVFSAALTFSASAEEGTPTDPVPTEESPAPSDTSGEAEPTPEPSPDESSSIEEGTTIEEATPTEAPAAEEPAVETMDESVVIDDSDALLAGLPEGTEVSVLDAEGEAIPLASEEAAEIIAGGDPIWCPAGVSPKPLMGGCSDSEASLSDLLTWLTNNEPSVSGVIWIEWDYSDTVNVEFNGTTLSTMKDYSLTFKGGWSGVSGSTALDPLQPYSEIDHYLWIYDWNNSITLSNLLFTGANNDGLYVETSNGNISLTKVDSTNNSAGGAYLQNDAGTGNVTINTGHFDENAGFGNLFIQSRGTITLSNVTANGNAFNYGAYLDNSTALSAKSVILTGVNEFSDNWTYGLQLASAGAVTTSNLSASGNGVSGTSGHGANINNTAGGAFGAPGVKLTGTNDFNDNYEFGLKIESNGAITISSVSANLNGGNGATLDNSSATSAKNVVMNTGLYEFRDNFYEGLEISSQGAVTIKNLTATGNGVSDAWGSGLYLDNSGAATAQSVMISGTNILTGNFDAGAQIYSAGAITASNLFANANEFYGVVLDNFYSYGLQPVTLTGRSEFKFNVATGLTVSSNGLVTLNNVTANSNQSDGVYVHNNNSGTTAGVKIAGINNMNNNSYYGLDIYSFGPVSLNSIIANNNGLASPISGGHGVLIENDGGPGTPGVTITGTNSFSNNYRDGLYITTLGLTKLNNVTATYNGRTGSLSGGGVIIDETGSVAGPVTISGTNWFSDNYDDGLFIRSTGAILLSNVTANGNILGNGVELNNSLAPSPANVTFSGTNQASNNYSNGIHIESYGAITLNSLSANYNGLTGSLSGSGLVVVGNGGTLARPFKLSGTNTFNGNYDNGLVVDSLGAISISNLTANDNLNGYGSDLDNSQAPSAQSVIISGTNGFSGNSVSGVEINSNGAVTMSNVMASDNGTGWGVKIDNTLGSFIASVTISGTNVMSGNQQSGLEVLSNGAIKVSSLTANSSAAGYGASLDNSGSSAGTPPGVSLTGKHTYEGNYDGGIYIGAAGNITSTIGIAANDNVNGHGADLSAGGLVSLAGINTFNSNDGSGLSIQADGPVTISKMTANENGDYGAQILNDNTFVANVTLSGYAVTSDNGGHGLNITSYGQISIANLTSSGNLGYGAQLYNWNGPVSRAVILSGKNQLLENGQDGLNIASIGPITIYNLNASGNGAQGDGSGLWIANSAGGAKPVKLLGTNIFNDNEDLGLQINSGGTVTLNNITANNNGILFHDGANRSGAYIYNAYAPTASVYLTGVNEFSGNDLTGLTIRTNGSVFLSRITADNNGSDGLHIDNGGAGTVKNVTITCGSFTANTSDGFDITYAGVLTLKGVVAAGNGGIDTYYFDSSPTTLPADVVTVRSC